MKRHLPLLLMIAFALLAVCSCRHRKSAEEGERFLQESRMKLIMKSDSTAYWEQKLVEAEFNYNFTPEQQVRLRLLQVYAFTPEQEVANEFLSEAETQAISLGNDSLLALIRRQRFSCHIKSNDTTRALRVFHQQEPLLVARKDTKELNFYLASLTLLYSRLNQMDNAIYWHLRTRPLRADNLIHWYSQMSLFLQSANRNNEAILYADSCLSQPSASAVSAYSVKAQVLAVEGRISEALAVCATAFLDIESTHKSRSLSTGYYSRDDSKLIFLYAKLLQQNGHPREAITLLEKTISHSKIPVSKSRNYDGLTTMTGQAIESLFPQELLAECYRLLGQTDKVIYYTHIADSLRRNYIAEMVKARNTESQSRSSNQYLTTRLFVKEQEAKNARLTQYILWSSVALLLLVIAGGLFWWRDRRRRLRQLFEQLMRRHAEWAQMLSLLSAGTIIPLQRGLESTLSQPESVNHRHYLCALRVMEEQRPFTNPTFDLVTLARLVGTNRTQLSAAINQHAHTSFSNWLAEYRINYLIAQLELQPNVTIDQLYPLAGFTTRSTFYRQFRLITGLTPKQYLKLLFHS